MYTQAELRKEDRARYIRNRKANILIVLLEKRTRLQTERGKYVSRSPEYKRLNHEIHVLSKLITKVA